MALVSTILVYNINGNLHTGMLDGTLNDFFRNNNIFKEQLHGITELSYIENSIDREVLVVWQQEKQFTCYQCRKEKFDIVSNYISDNDIEYPLCSECSPPKKENN